jgi:hypothetical protein
MTTNKEAKKGLGSIRAGKTRKDVSKKPDEKPDEKTQ